MNYKLTQGANVIWLKDQNELGQQDVTVIAPNGNGWDLYRGWLEGGNSPLPADPAPVTPKPTKEELQAELQALAEKIAAL